MQPVQRRLKIEESVCLIDELPQEVFEKILERLDGQSLNNLSQASKLNRKAIWYNPRYATKAIHACILEDALGTEQEKSDYFLSDVATAYSTTNFNRAMELTDQIKDPLEKIKALLQVAKRHKSNRALQILEQAFRDFQALQNPPSNSSYLLFKFTKALAPLNSQLALEAVKLIPKENAGRYLDARIEVARFLYYDQKKNILDEAFSACVALPGRYYIPRILQIAELVNPEREIEIIDHLIQRSISQSFSDADTIRAVNYLAPKDPIMALTLASGISSHFERARVGVAFYPNNPRVSKMLFRQAMEQASWSASYLSKMRLCSIQAKLVSLWDLEAAKKLYVNYISRHRSYQIDAEFCKALAAIDEELAFEKLSKVKSAFGLADALLEFLRLYPENYLKYYSLFDDKETSPIQKIRFAQLIINKDPLLAAKLHREAYEQRKGLMTRESLATLLKC